MPEDRVTYNTVVWQSLDDHENPLNWSPGKKWFLVAVCCVYVLVASIGSSIVSPALSRIVLHFDVTAEVAALTIALYILGWACGPLIWAPMSEIYGRNVVYTSTWCISVLFHLGAALSKSVEALLVCRLFGGIFVSASITIVGGTFSDCFNAQERGVPAGLLFMCGFLGPVLGPIIGGFATEHTNSWEWSLRILVIVAGAVTPLRFFCSETHAQTLLTKRARILRRQTGDILLKSESELFGIPKSQVFRIAIWRPLQLLVLEPIVMCISMYGSLVYSILYIFLAAFPRLFREAYNWKEGYSGAAFGGIGVGVLLSMATLRRANNLYQRLSAKHADNGVYPEGRLPFAMVAAILTPVSIFWLAWSAKARVHCMAPIASGVLFGWSMVILFTTFATYITDTYSSIAASALASHNLLRCVLAFAFTILSPTMYNELGNQWATSLAGFLAVAFVPLPFVFYKYGPFIRSKSRFKPAFADSVQR